MLALESGASVKVVDKTRTFNDVSGSEWYADSVTWAMDAMAWAVGVGILNGTTDANGSVILNPQGNASRAQVTAMTERFCGKIAK